MGEPAEELIGMLREAGYVIVEITEIDRVSAVMERMQNALQSIACTDADCSCVKLFGSPTENCVYGKARAALGEDLA